MTGWILIPAALLFGHGGRILNAVAVLIVFFAARRLVARGYGYAAALLVQSLSHVRSMRSTPPTNV